MPPSDSVMVSQESNIGMHSQSPINIEEKNVKFQEFPPLKLAGHEKLSIARGTLEAQNTGTTLKLVAKDDVGMLGGGPLNVQYEFLEMHFHWGDYGCIDERKGSEHKINGKSYPIELHMVHKNIHDASVKDAVSHENGLCVLGFVFDIVEDDNHLPALDSLARVVEHLGKPGAVVDQAKLKELALGDNFDVNIANFIPRLLSEYFTYKGSLTTGNYEEAVTWIVFKTPLAIKKEHLKTIQTLRNNEEESIKNNYRGICPINKRTVYYHGEDLLAREVISVGRRVVEPAPVVGEGSGKGYEKMMSTFYPRVFSDLAINPESKSGMWGKAGAEEEYVTEEGDAGGAGNEQKAR